MDESYWSISADETLRQLESTPAGLATVEADRRLADYGSNRLQPRRQFSWVRLLLAQFKSPITLILIGAAGLSYFLYDETNATIILVIVAISGLLGFWQEHSAANAHPEAVGDYQGEDERVARWAANRTSGGTYCSRRRDYGLGWIRHSRRLPALRSEGSVRLRGKPYRRNLSGGEAACSLGTGTSLGHRTNSLFMGTHVVSGTARAVVVRTGRQTEFGQVCDRLQARSPETEFELGVRHFGYFLSEITLLMVLGIFAANVMLDRPVLETFLFSLALAVGLTPQLLPAIISVNLAHGARRMAQQDVIVRRLSAIENLGSMDILCSDKTGTLTEGVIHLHAAEDATGVGSEKVLKYAYMNAVCESGFTNPIDTAIRAVGHSDLASFEKLDEVPYDFIRKRLSVLVVLDGQPVLITKGAVENVLAVCSQPKLLTGRSFLWTGYAVPSKAATMR